MRGELPSQKCKTALDSVEFVDKPLESEVASCFADIVTQMAQDVSVFSSLFLREIKRKLRSIVCVVSKG